MAMDAGLWSPRRPHEREAAMAIASTPCSPLPAITSALGYNEDRRQLQLMVGRQARHGGPTCGAEYILSEARGRGRRRCGVGREEDSDQRCQDRCPAIFISKIFSQKIWPKNWGGSSMEDFGNGTCAGPVLLHPAPPFVQMKNTPGGRSRGADFQARHSVRAIDHWSVDRRLATSFMPM
jgi:hypothetical protein